MREREGENLRERGDLSAAKTSLSLWFFPSHSHAPHVCRRQTAQCRLAKHARPAKFTFGQTIRTE